MERVHAHAEILCTAGLMLLGDSENLNSKWCLIKSQGILVGRPETRSGIIF